MAQIATQEELDLLSKQIKSTSDLLSGFANIYSNQLRETAQALGEGSAILKNLAGHIAGQYHRVSDNSADLNQLYNTSSAQTNNIQALTNAIREIQKQQDKHHTQATNLAIQTNQAIDKLGKITSNLMDILILEHNSTTAKFEQIKAIIELNNNLESYHEPPLIISQRRLNANEDDEDED